MVPKANNIDPAFNSYNSFARYALQLFISLLVGLFSGGKHFTALLIRQSISFKLSFCIDLGLFENPYLYNAL